MNGFENLFGASDRDEPCNLALTLEALYQLANAADWEQTYHILQEWDAVLLSNFTLSHLHLTIEHLETSGEIWAATSWWQYLHLLEDAREQGITEAWEYFITQQHEASLAHDALVSARTAEKLYAVLEKWLAVLLTDAAMVMLRETISQEYAADNLTTAAHLDQLLRDN